MAPSMKSLLAIGLAAATSGLARASSCKNELMQGTMPVKGQQEVYLGGQGGVVNEGDLIIRHNSGFSAFSECAKDWEPESIAQFKLLGQRMSFTVDLSRVGCACNLAFYLIGAPAKDVDGKPSQGDDRGGQPPYYCDANMVGGQWCPEMDIMEANNKVFQATAHSCDQPVNGHYFFCDRSGCDESTKTIEHAYGPGDGYSIDTRLAFEVQTDFLEGKEGVFTGMVTTLKQGTREVVLEHATCHPEYLNKLSDVLRDGMSLRITYWGGDAQTMAWMDMPTCGDTACQGDNAGYAVINSISVSEVPQTVYDAQEARKALEVAATPAVQTWSAAPSPPAWAWSPPDATTTAQDTWNVPAAPAAQDGFKEQWVSDIYQPWECHEYQNPKQEQTMWCVTAGMQEGYEFQYNAGDGGPCGPCWCCKRRAKFVFAPVTTTPAPLSNQEELVWIVVDPKDDKFGKVVPDEILQDGSHSAILHDQGVIEWEEKSRFVKHVPRAGLDDFMKSNGDPTFLGMIMEKYQGETVVKNGMTGVASHWWWALACAMSVLAFASLGLMIQRRAKSRVATTGSRSLDSGEAKWEEMRPHSPERMAAAPSLDSSLGDASPGGGTPVRRVRSGNFALLLPRNNSSCQSLLALTEPMV
mmetsp:Transcript_78245/g.198889  ORF Transcript_78245/g.198889 Transcript_78245/m.198889 type:complete len:638 (-) Transcript_78245:150-2063(-)